MRRRSAKRLLHACLSRLTHHLFAVRRRLSVVGSPRKRRCFGGKQYRRLRPVGAVRVLVPKGHVAVYVGSVESEWGADRGGGEAGKGEGEGVVKRDVKDGKKVKLRVMKKKQEEEEEEEMVESKAGEMVMERFVVPISYLRHELFTELLEQAKQEFGLDPSPPLLGLRLPCSVSQFRHTLRLISSTRHHRPLLRSLRLVHPSKFAWRIHRFVCCRASSAQKQSRS